VPRIAAANGIRRATAFNERPTIEASHLGGGSEPDIEKPSQPIRGGGSAPLGSLQARCRRGSSGAGRIARQVTLTQPFGAVLSRAQRILFVGAGGGYDILGAVPLAAELFAAGKQVHFAGVTFSAVSTLPGTQPHPAHPALYPVTAESAVRDRYCPEAWLARWLETTHGYREPLWLLKKCGVRPASAAYGWLATSLSIDTIVLVDGGVDVLLKGNETSIGTPVEDLCSLAALDGVDVPTRLIACIGFGSELREGVRHAQVLERMAELTAAGAHLGTAALSLDTAPGRAYRDALEFTFAHQEGHKQSHVHAIVLSSLRGFFGGSEPDVWVSPLASLFWFFDLPTVARTHVFLPHLAQTESVFDLTAIVRECRKALPARPSSAIPI
jgi:hypothetical protein